MRVLCAGLTAAVAALSACATEDPWAKRPGHGGPGGSTDPVDASADDAGTTVDDELLGRVCVILDFQAPYACPDIPLGRGVQVRDVPTVSTVVSDNATLFAMPATTATVTVEVGGVAGDGLHPTQSVVRNTTGTSPADAAVFDQALWDTMLTSLLEAETAGALVVYVVDGANQPVRDATVTHGTAPIGQRTFYDDGVGGWDIGALVTGPDGIALLLDSVGGVVSASADGFAAGSVAIPTGAGAAGIGVITLTPAP